MPARPNILFGGIVFGVLTHVMVQRMYAAIEFTIETPTNNNDEIEVSAIVSGLSGSSCSEGKCFLQAMFTKEGKTNYFGYTQNNENQWYEYQGSPAIEVIKANFFAFQPHEGSWSGKLKAKNNYQDNGYEGPGDYTMIVRRYTGKSSSHAGESNSLTVTLTSALPTPVPTPTPTTSATATPQATAVVRPTPAPTSTPTTVASPSPEATDQAVGVVAGAAIEGGQTAASSSTWQLDHAVGTMAASFSGEVWQESVGHTQAVSNSKSGNKIILGGVITLGSVVSLAIKRYNSGLRWLIKR